MKKKVLTVALVIAMLAIMVTGTLAYFTADDKATNTFTVGSVLIDIWENGTPTDTDVITFTEPLLPVVNTQDVTQDKNYAPKVVKVENTGISDAYIRTHIAVPTKLIGYLELRVNLVGSGWKFIGATTATVENVDYTVFTYDYEKATVSGEFTTDLLLGAYLRSEVDIKDNPATTSADLEFCKPDGNGGYIFSDYVAHSKTNTGYTSNTVSVLVASEAIQAKGFTGTATEALNTGFGADTNPWK